MAVKYTHELLSNTYDYLFEKVRNHQPISELEHLLGAASGHALDVLEFSKDLKKVENNAQEQSNYSQPESFDISLEKTTPASIDHFIVMFGVSLLKERKLPSDCVSILQKKVSSFMLFYLYNELVDNGFTPEIRCFMGRLTIFVEGFYGNGGQGYDISKAVKAGLSGFSFQTSESGPLVMGSFNKYYDTVSAYFLQKINHASATD